MTSTSSVLEPTAQPQVDDGLVPVSALAVQSLAGIDFDVFVKIEQHGKPVLYRSWELILSRKVRKHTEQFFFIRLGDYVEFCQHLQENLDLTLADDTIAVEDRMSLLQEAVSFEVEQAFSLINCKRLTQLSKQTGRQIASLLHESGTLPKDLFGVVRHDYLTFTHVTNVASYAVLLAERIGIRDPRDLEAIATGGFLHDMGKRLIPKRILCKPSALTAEERAVIQEHPQRGYEELCKREDLSFDQLMMVYQHHERIDGTGYPVRITGEEIHPWARLCAVVDVFDALTGKRPYRKAATVEFTLDFLHKNAGTHFDKDIVRCWIAAMQNN